jgi:hypothetical protein
MNLCNSVRSGLLLLAAVPLLSARPARAVEDERFTAIHGTTCRVTNGVTPLISTAGIGNPNTTTTMNLDCALPVTARTKFAFLTAVHTVVGTDGNPLGTCDHTDTTRRPWVEVYDRNANADVSCRLLVLGDANTIISAFTVQSSGAQGAVQKLFFPMSSFQSITGNRLYMQCSVPPKTNDFSFVARVGMPTCDSDSN